jgi:hypothetical protein
MDVIVDETLVHLCCALELIKVCLHGGQVGAAIEQRVVVGTHFDYLLQLGLVY